MKTTDQMDGLLTPEDIALKNSIFLQCRHCTKWSPSTIGKKQTTCIHCGSTEFDLTSATSARTFNPLTKRKVK